MLEQIAKLEWMPNIYMFHMLELCCRKHFKAWSQFATMSTRAVSSEPVNLLYHAVLVGHLLLKAAFCQRLGLSQPYLGFRLIFHGACRSDGKACLQNDYRFMSCWICKGKKHYIDWYIGKNLEKLLTQIVSLHVAPCLKNEVKMKPFVSCCYCQIINNSMVQWNNCYHSKCTSFLSRVFFLSEDNKTKMQLSTKCCSEDLSGNLIFFTVFLHRHRRLLY